jgi:hypothetical protein
MSLVLRELSHEIPVQERFDVVAIHARVRERVTTGLREEVPARAFRGRAERRQPDASHSYT